MQNDDKISQQPHFHVLLRVIRKQQIYIKTIKNNKKHNTEILYSYYVEIKRPICNDYSAICNVAY